MRPRGLGDVDGTEVVHLDHPPVVRERQVFDPFERSRDPRIVHHDVDGAEVVERGLDDRRRAVLLRDRCVTRDRNAAGRLDLLHDLVGRIRRGSRPVEFAAEIGNDHVRATRREEQGVRAPDAATGARDDHRAAVESQLVHVCLLITR